MRLVLLFCYFLIPIVATADTINHYMSISNQIPQMEMKADAQSQNWARSARNVLIVSDESIAETLMEANEMAKKRGNPLFCLPSGAKLTASELDKIITQTYRNLSGQQADKDNMTVSQIAWLGVVKTYPCQTTPSKDTPHISSVSGQQSE